MDRIYREERELERRHEAGEISDREYRFEMRELYLGLESDAREAAREAYDREMGY